MITAELKKDSQGQLRVKGTQVDLIGKVNAAHQILKPRQQTFRLWYSSLMV